LRKVAAPKTDGAEVLPEFDKGSMFAFFSNRLGCLGSIIVSVVGSVILLLVLRGCGAVL